jgi:hypothetical protein
MKRPFRRPPLASLILCTIGCTWGIPALVQGNAFGWYPVAVTVIVFLLSWRYGSGQYHTD